MKYLLILLILFSACGIERKPDAQEIINQSIAAHGLDKLMGKKLAFDFRDKHYNMELMDDQFIYTRSFADTIGEVKDVLVNSSEFTRYVNGEKFEVEKEWSDKYASSVNSVLYFIQLPRTLNDPSVIKSYQGKVEINGEPYHQVEVRFEEEGGGEDFQDIFLYWFNEQTYLMDYLAYSYITDGGGVRFREAINRRTIDGVVFQDYINYKPASKDTPLTEMLNLYEKGELIELSRIENENILID